MDNKIERVAAAILREASTLNNPKIQDDLTPGRRLNNSQVWARRYARAAIEAMRDPTEAMTFATFEFLPGSWEHADISRAWNAGIDEALKEPT